MTLSPNKINQNLSSEDMKKDKEEEETKDFKSKIVLDYGDYIIRQSDVDILVNNEWLNDILIGFYFNYLADLYAVKKECVYVGPEVAQLLKMVEPGQVEMIIGDDLKEELKTKAFVFIAVNDSHNADAHNSGSHWSLLVYSRKDKTTVHVDSSGNHNFEDAMGIHAKLKKYLDSHKLVYLGGCNQQVNGRDCGLHVICNALKISEDIKKDFKIKDFVTSDAKDASKMRNDLVTLIHDLAKSK